MSPFLRSPIPSDYAAIASWIPDATACARWAGPQMRYPFLPAELPELLASENASSYAMVDAASGMLGFGQLVRQQRSVLRLSRIIIAPHRRGLGLGASMCRLLLAQATSYLEVELVTLGVYRDNSPAIALYSRLGFAERTLHPGPEIMAMERVITHD